jgi:hypothetical protein
MAWHLQIDGEGHARRHVMIVKVNAAGATRSLTGIDTSLTQGRVVKETTTNTDDSTAWKKQYDETSSEFAALDERDGCDLDVAKYSTIMGALPQIRAACDGTGDKLPGFDPAHVEALEALRRADDVRAGVLPARRGRIGRARIRRRWSSYSQYEPSQETLLCEVPNT